MHNPPTRRSLSLALLMVGLVWLLFSACTGAPTQTLMTGRSPAWACPSPTPKPYGEAGPVKEWIDGDALPTRVPSGPVRHEQIPVYYAEWEQEYGDLAEGTPFPSPTPYVIQGTVFPFGRRVRIEPLFVTVDARAGDVSDDGRQLHLITITWLNTTTTAMPIDYAAQVILRSVRSADGSEVMGDGWRVGSDSLQAIGQDTLPTTIPEGLSSVVVPVLGPLGEPANVNIVVRRDPTFQPIYGTTDPTLPTPTLTPVLTATPNTELRAASPDDVVVSFTLSQPVNPPCEHAGAITDWDTDGATVEGVADVPVNAPPGAGRLVELAVAQIGKRYVWGTAGPETFDCSGLVSWVYGQIGIKIPARTADGQFRAMKPVSGGAALPGDTLYFNASGDPANRATHAAIYTGDLNGDGVGDVVHAASPKYGVLLIRNGLQNPFYFGNDCQLCAVGFRTMR